MTYTLEMLVLIVLNVLPRIGPKIIRAAITTMATKTRINAYSTNPCPRAGRWVLTANNIAASPFRRISPLAYATELITLYVRVAPPALADVLGAPAQPASRQAPKPGRGVDFGRRTPTRRPFWRCKNGKQPLPAVCRPPGDQVGAFGMPAIRCQRPGLRIQPLCRPG